MLVDEKPPLDEDLLLHYGIPGMKWGQRKAPDPLVGRRPGMGPPDPTGRSESSAVEPASTNRSSLAAAPPRRPMSKGTKVAIGIAGVAAASYVLSKYGMKPRAQAMTSSSNRAGARMALGVLKRSGKVGVGTLKRAPGVAKVAGKATFKTTRFAGRQATRGVVSVSKASGRSIQTAYNNLKNTPAKAPTSISGKRFGNMLLGSYGPRPVSSLKPFGSLRQVMADRAIKRSLGR